MPAGGGPRRRRRRGATMAKILCVLYPDPVEGYPSTYPRADIPVLERYPNGQMLPTPKDIDFTPGQLLGSVSGELDLRKFLESQGHTLSLIHISEPTRLGMISYAVFCLKKKKKTQ